MKRRDGTTVRTTDICAACYERLGLTAERGQPRITECRECGHRHVCCEVSA